MAIEAAFIVPHPPLIIPAIGKGEEQGIQKTIDAYEEVSKRIAQIAPDTIVLTSPHATLYSDYFHISPGAHAKGDMGKFYAYDEKMEVDYDEEFVGALCKLTSESGFPAGTKGEREPKLDHASYVPLYFVNHHYNDYRLVRMGLSGLSPLEHYQMGKYIAKVAEDLNRKVVFVASGDLSHVLKEDGPYGYQPEGPKFDQEVTQAMADGDFMRFLTFDEGFCDDAAECGLRSFQIMAGALDGKAVTHELLSYEGPFGVGYGVAAFKVTGDDASRHFDEAYRKQEQGELDEAKAGEDPYVQLARLTVETFVNTGERVAVPAGLPDDMVHRRAGVFVTLKKHHRLRGCIGTIGPVMSSVATEIIENGISACSRDPRFLVVQPSELDELTYSVDVLGPTEKIDSPEELDVKRYGVIVTHGSRRGLLLPNLDGVDTVEKQISIARQKAGIGEDEPVDLERFEVIRHT